MTLLLTRGLTKGPATISPLMVNGAWACWVLEDPIRERPGQPVAVWKAKGNTAIPAGTYVITLTQSARFGRVLPLLNDVPGFSGIRIHPGNTSASTEGCLLLGYDKWPTSIGRSRLACEDLLEQMEDAAKAGEAITIQITNP